MFERMLASYEEVPVLIEDQKISSVAVIGADPIGQSIACAALAAGCQVNLHTSFGSESRKLIDAGSIVVDGSRLTGTYDVTEQDVATREPVIRVVHELDTAIKDVDAIILAVPASLHATYASLLARAVRPDQVIVVAPGRGMGALEVARVMRSRCAQPGITVAETSTVPFVVTQPHPGQLVVEAEHRVVWAAALRSGDTSAVVSSLAGIFPALRAARSVLETSFTNTEGLLVAAPALLAASSEARATLRDRLPAQIIGTVLAQLDRERIKTAFAYGVRDLPTLHEWLEVTYGTVEKDIVNALDEVGAYGRIACPSASDPVVRDAVATSLVPIASTGAAAGVPTPATSALITLASTLHGIDHARNGRTMASLGLDRMRPDEVRRALEGDSALAQEVLA